MIAKLNDTQRKQAEDLLKFYKYIYVCNVCGSVYGTDRPEEKLRFCHTCDVKLKQEKK